MRNALLVLTFVAVAGGRAVAKDLVLVQQISGSRSSVPYNRTEYLTPTLRAVDGPYARTVIDAKTRTVTVIDKEDHTYWQTSFESLRRETEALATDTHIRDPKFRAPVTLKPTGATKTIAGHPAEEFALEGGYPTGKVWLAKDIESPADPSLWKDWPGLGSRLGMDGKLADAVLAMKRVALRIETQSTGMSKKVTVSAETTAVRDDPPPADLISIPEGYTRASRRSQSH